MQGFFFKYNGQMNTEYDVMVVKRPDIPSPKKKYSTFSIDGRDGDLYEEDGTYEDIDILLQMNFKGEPDDWNEKLRRIRRWLNNTTNNKLVFSDDMDYFYKVKKVSISDTKRSKKRAGRFDITFTCDPYTYLADGESLITDISNVIVNLWEISKPIYYIFGNGKMSLNINGKNVTMNVQQALTVDTQMRLCYGAGNFLQNTAIYGDYDSLFFYPGENNISFTDGFEVQIRPNWRSI